jgi:hypothetical protein
MTQTFVPERSNTGPMFPEIGSGGMHAGTLHQLQTLYAMPHGRPTNTLRSFGVNGLRSLHLRLRDSTSLHH